ncbi:MAG: L-dopachrome tautomerase-related protein [Pseudomonadota bacterium]
MTRVLLGFAALFLVALLVVRLIYGGGRPYPELVIQQGSDATRTEIVFEYAEPIGGIAVGDRERVFFTVHSASRPQGNQLLRIEDGIAAPFPDGAAQQDDFITPLGLALDGNNRLWVLDHGKHGTAPARLMAFDADSGERVHEHSFDGATAPRGSFLQSLAVTRDGATVYVADTSLFRRKPALIVYDVASGTARRVLEQAMPVTSQGYRIEARGKRMQFFGGLFSVMPGIAGVALDADERWLYLAATSHDGLYRVATEMLGDPAVAPQTLEGSIERYSDKPLSAGVAIDDAGDLLVTDIENGSIIRISDDRRPRAFAAPEDLRWPSGVAVSDDGALWYGDSALQDYLFGSPEQVEAGAPYRIYRTRTEPAP